jgi:hypothetical protein
MNTILHDPGAWIAIGVSVLFLVVTLVMYLVFMKILRAPAPDGCEETSKNEP